LTSLSKYPEYLAIRPRKINGTRLLRKYFIDHSAGTFVVQSNAVSAGITIWIHKKQGNAQIYIGEPGRWKRILFLLVQFVDKAKSGPILPSVCRILALSTLSRTATSLLFHVTEKS
jgi:hypothetical protein